MLTLWCLGGYNIFQMSEHQAMDTNAMLPVGAVLQMGKYRIDGYLASGGFGNTYVITNLQFDEQYALKEFFIRGISERDDNNTTVSVSNRTNITQFEGQKEKFKKEARRLRKLHNPHIIGVHDLFEENGTAYYVMDFVDGESLAARLKRTQTPLSEQETLDVLSQVLEALSEVHSMDIWHLDLKPANILIDKHGNVALIDFGSSKQFAADGSGATTTSMCYTPGYAPTEQVDQNMERIGAWTDLYSLGATLYNLLTNQQPPSVSDIQDGDAFIFPSEVSEKTRYMITWMMKPKRSLRPQSVTEVRDFLQKPFVTDKPKVEEYDDTTRFVNSAPKEVVHEEETPTEEEEASIEYDFSDLEEKPYKKWIITSIICLALVAGGYYYFSPKTTNTASSSEVVDLIANNYLKTESQEIDDTPESKKAARSTRKIDKGKATDKKDVKRETTPNDETSKTVKKFSYTSAIGTYSYTGSLDDKGRPHGTGTASFSGGSYTGNFVHGEMSGSGTLRNSNGTFKGTFSNNYFVNGRYTATNGTYFVGSFSGGKPANGTWYDENGIKIE